MYVSMPACMHVCLYASMHACMSLCMHVCMSLCQHACMSLCMHACMSLCQHACMYVCLYACMHVCLYASMHACMSLCMFVCLRDYMYVVWFSWFSHINEDRRKTEGQMQMFEMLRDVEGCPVSCSFTRCSGALYLYCTDLPLKAFTCLQYVISGSLLSFLVYTAFILFSFPLFTQYS